MKSKFSYGLGSDLNETKLEEGNLVRWRDCECIGIVIARGKEVTWLTECEEHKGSGLLNIPVFNEFNFVRVPVGSELVLKQT